MEAVSTDLKRTALTDTHTALGAKMVPFAGYLMPVQYSGLMEEHQCVRSNVGVFDVSHMGEFWITGPNAFSLIQYITSNDVSKLYDGKVQYSCLPNGKGGIVDDLLVYRKDAETYLLVVNAGNIAKDWEWISKHNERFGATMRDASAETSLLAVQGPNATAVLQKLTDLDLASMEYYTFQIGTFAGVENIVVSATGYTGAGGFEIYFPNEVAEHMWKAIFDAGKDHDILPIGLGARDTLRLEMGFCLYGNDIDDTTSPLEAGLGWITKFAKEFIDGEYLKEQKAAGLQRKLVGIELVDKGIPRHGYEITNATGAVIGVVTSGTQSPSLGKAIGLGYVPTSMSALGSEIFISVRGKQLKAVVTGIPFYKK